MADNITQRPYLWVGSLISNTIWLGIKRNDHTHSHFNIKMAGKRYQFQMTYDVFNLGNLLNRG